MKLLGIDFGTKKIGLALAEEGIVTPLEIIKFSNCELRIEEICQKEKVVKIVVGISEGKSGQRAKAFAKKLARITNLPVELADETLTTSGAKAKMKQVGKKWRNKEDALAAALILEGYV